MDEASKEELHLIEELRNNVGDMRIAKHHLETRNLLRFLRARNGSIKNAENMFRLQIEWREDNMMDEILKWEPPKEFKYKSFWPWAISGFDQEGRPSVIEFGLWDPTKVSENYENFIKQCYLGIECLWQGIQLKSQGQKAYKQFLLIMDLKGLSFRTVTTFAAMQGVVEAVRAFEANYPETMKIGILLNAPYVFEIAWRLVKPFLSDYTYSKLRFLGGEEEEWKVELAKYVPMDQVWEKFGGTLPDSYDISINMMSAKREEGNHASYNEFNANSRIKAAQIA